jgi:hypothetical protein
MQNAIRRGHDVVKTGTVDSAKSSPQCGSPANLTLFISRALQSLETAWPRCKAADCANFLLPWLHSLLGDKLATRHSPVSMYVPR